MVIDVIFKNIVVGSGGSGAINIRNSDGTFNITTSTSPLIFPDDTYNFIINGATVTQTVTTLVTHTFNITI
ncbi:MAG: hypothetical protein ABI241_00450 [Bacteroidia bacterium]